MRIESPHLSVKPDDIYKPKPETVKKLMEDPIAQINFVIEQKEKIEAALTDEEKQDPLIQVKLRAIERSIERFNEQLAQMTDIVNKAIETANACCSKLLD